MVVLWFKPLSLEQWGQQSITDDRLLEVRVVLTLGGAAGTGREHIMGLGGLDLCGRYEYVHFKTICQATLRTCTLF